MKAVVLVGGEGTRLRPLTETVKKELLPLVDRPILDRILDHLARHGVEEVVLSSSYLENTFRPFLDARREDPAVVWVAETEPLDTGGAIVNALHALDTDDAFLALNGDILTDLDLTAMIAAHLEHSAAATIALTHVDDARPFGLVSTAPDGRVLEFREKPTDPIPGDVNAGTYVLSPAALDAWPRGVAVSIEREVFPALIGGGRLVHGFGSDAYWLDLGTPEKYLRANFDILEGKVGFEPAYPAPYVADGAVVDPRSHLGRRVVVGTRARVAAGARIEDSVLHAGAEIGPEAMVVGSIIGPGARVGAGADVDASVLAERSGVPDGARVSGVRVSAGQVHRSG